MTYRFDFDKDPEYVEAVKQSFARLVDDHIQEGCVMVVHAHAGDNNGIGGVSGSFCYGDEDLAEKALRDGLRMVLARAEERRVAK